MGSPSDGKDRASGGFRWRLVLAVVFGVTILSVVGLAVWEMRTSWFQARWFSERAERLTWSVEEGPSTRIVFPESGPYDERLGYVRIPEMRAAAESVGFVVTRQARVSPDLLELTSEHGLFPIYREKAQAGLSLVDRDGQPLIVSRFPGRVFESFEAIPPLLWQTLLFIENRTLLDESVPTKNPAVEWPRLFLSASELGLRMLGREGNVPGASTLATQLEKFRHSPDGLTGSPREKLLQMASASFRAYLDGPETLDARRRVVLDYLNSVPLAAQRGEGEVSGIGDGMWSWYGRSLEELASLHHAGEGPAEELESHALIYREALSLLLAQRRPTYYLTQSGGQESLDNLTDEYLGLLEEGGLLSPRLAAAARSSRSSLRVVPPSRERVSFVDRKAENAVRAQLLGVLDVGALYELDRLDLQARTTFDAEAQQRTTDFISSLGDPDTVRARGLSAAGLLDRGDPSRVVYSLVLHERTPLGNVVRVQTDNLDAPFNLNESARLELGSTAKLRTLVSYVEIVADLHGRFSELDPDSLRSIEPSPRDPLSGWVRTQLLQDGSLELTALLRRSLDRTYSASPGERFATGGGVQTFSNFDSTYDRSTLPVSVAFQQSVNLVFVRMMRDIVNHYVYRNPGSMAHVLEDVDSPERQEYLVRFADREGIQFIDRFLPKFDERTRGAILSALFEDRRLSPQRMAWAYRSVVGDGSPEELGTLLRTHLPDVEFNETAAAELFGAANPGTWTWADLGYLASIHPLEMWVARYLLENPEASRAEVVGASGEARQEVYRWLFRTSRRGAQDQRIRFLLEIEAYEEILDGWHRLGYPFGNIVPSLGTSIGSSGDRPSALGELVGIVLNDGVRLPTYRVSELHFGEGTPFETAMAREPEVGERVMSPDVALVLREAMVSVVEQGTARRIQGAFTGPDGGALVVGGKTGTGDNRYRTFGPGGQLMESRSVNRTSTFVFFIGDRLHGVATAYVPGEEADEYRFTSALPTQIVRELAPVIESIYIREAVDAETPAGPEGAVPQGASGSRGVDAGGEEDAG